MKIFNYFSKLIVISILSILSFNSFGQKIVMDSVSFPSPQIVCNTDTVSFFFKTGIDTSVTPNLPYSNTDIHVDLPDGFKFVDIVYTESIDISKVPAVNINSSNPDDLVFSFNGFMLNPYSTLFELKIVVEPSCGANASTSSAFVTRGGTTNAVSDTITTTLVQVDEPYLVFQGLSNTTSSNASINLSRLAIGQKFMRCFKVDYTSLISSIGEITVKIANDNNYYSFDWVTPGVTKTIVNDTVIYKFDAAFFTTIGNANGVIEPGESFTFCDSVTVLGNCNSQNSNIKVDYVMSWGCGGFNCQNTSIAAEGIISLSPTKISTTARPDLDVKPNLCDTCGSGLVKYGFQFVNNTSAILPTGGFLTNLKFELGTARYPFSIASQPILDSINHCFDSVKINGVTVPFTIGANASVEVANLTSFTGIGLADIDGDGIFDDLATGDTLVFELFGTFYANKHDTSALAYNLNGGNTDAQPYLIDAVRGGLDVTYYDECGGNEKEVRVISSLYNHLNPTNSSSTITPDFFDRGSYTLNMTHGEYNRTTGYDCDSAIRQTIVVLPKDVSLDTTKAYPFSNYPSNSTDSVVFWVEKDGPNDVDTLYIYYSTKGENITGGTRNSSVTLRYDCSGGLCPEADSLRTIFWYQNYICINDAAAECYKTAMFRGKRLVRFHCDLPPQGLSLRTFNIERTTFGYTDSTETTKVNRNTPGIALRKAQVADTVEVTLKGVINNATLDSAHARFSYHTQQFQGGTKPVFRIDDVNSKVTIYDASTATHHTFRLNAPGLFSGEYGPQRVGVTENYDFQWNLSTYKDSIGGGYQFTGANTTASTWDSIIMDIVMIVEDNSYAGDFQIDPFAQMIEFPEDTATQCDIYGGLFSIDQNSISIFARPSNSFGSCVSRSNVVEFRTNSQDDYPNEYKRNERITEIRYSWDPTYFSDPDSVQFTYYWRDDLGAIISGNQFVNRTAQYTQTGNSIVIPMEKSVNINVLPESWWYGYINVFQTATCAIKDSMPIAQLGIKAEMDVERFTNSSTTTIITQYDSTFSYYGNASANILVDIPTPFNITASPIVASTTSDSVCWDITYNNLSFTNINNTWLDFSSDSIQITSISRVDSGLSIPQTLLSYGTNGLWIQSDTINSTDFKTYRVCAQYSTCKLDSIVLTGGWNCDKYPTDPTSGYAPTAYSCEHNQQTMSVYIEELEAKLQVNIVNSSPMPFNLCDTLFYDVQMANIDLTDLKNLVFSAKFPSTSNLSIYPGSTKLIWAYDGVNTTEIALTDPVRIGDSLAWDLTGQFSSSSLRNFEILNDSNYALIKVRFNTNCVMFPNDAIKFQVQGTRGCDKLVVSKEATSTPFQVNGLLPKVNRLTDIQIYLDTIQACDTASKVDLSFFNIFTKSTRGSEVLAVKLPASFDISGGIYGAHRDSLLQSLVPTNTVTGGVRTLEWFVKAGMPTAGPTGIPGADSLSFSFSIVPITEVTCSIDTLIEAKVFERYFIYCVTDSSVPCEIVYPLDEDRTGFTVTKGDLSLNNISTILDGCTDSLDINFGFTNNGTTIAPGTTTKFKLYVDINGNGTVDATDPIFDSIIYTDSIPGGSSGTINHKALASNYAAGEICNLIVMIDSSSSCICDSSSASLPVELNMNLTDSILCDIDTLNLGVCAGTGNYAARTYTWYDVDGMGRQIYLSNVNALSPTFNPPTVTVNTTFRFAVQVNRGGCTNEDTISIEVKASPLPFDVMDDTICESDCIALAVSSPQAGITYNVYDGLGSWLGTLPYNACPTSTSTYYFEAIDSALGCGAVIDTAIVTVISKMSPGVSSTIAGCGIGCTINLFDTLGGAPDTTGTWTDPSGNPFGTGYNVTFNANSDPVGIYTYTISNMPCADTMATVTVLAVTDTVPIITNEDTPITVGAPSIGGAGPISTITTSNGPTNGTVITDPVTGTITYVPDTNYVGFDTVSVIVCYTAGNCDTTVLTITVLPVMDTTPVVILEDSSFVLCPGTDSTTTVRNFGTVSILCGPMHGDTVVDPITGCVTYEADSNYVGQDTLCIVICDTVAGMCDTTLVPITIVPVRDTVLETIPEGDTLTLCPPSITVVDVLGSMDSLCPPMHGTMILDTTTGCVTYVPDTNFSGVDTLCFVKCDTAGVCDTTTVIISVDPVTDTIPLITNEDVPVSVGQPILSGVSPVDTVSYLNGPDYGTIVIDTTATGVPTGTITYVPDTNYVGFDTVTVVTCDDLGNCDTTIVLITVLPVMDTTPVVILEDSSFVLCPGTDSTTTVRNFGTVSILCGPMHGDTVVDPITGCVTYEADSNYVGQDTLCIVICDTVAGMCDTTLVPITIVPVRDTVLETIPEGDTLTLCPPSITVVDVLGSMDSLCPPMHGTMILDTTTGCVTYVPDTNFSGVDTLCFVKCDTAGVCDTTTVIISVDPVTDTIPLITNEDVPVSVGQPILSGVSPVDTVSYLNGPDYGTIVIDTTATGVPTGTITYVPDTNYVGFDTVTVVTCDDLGNCDTTIVLITVLPVMDTTPVVILEDSSFVLCPGTDSTTTVRNFGTVSILCGPMHGDTVVDPITGCVTYEADSNYVGQDTLCIVICDTVAGMCDTTLVPITIVPVRDTVLDTISEGDTLTLCPPSITVVDVLGSMDSLCPPMHGTMILDTTTGCVTYVPDTNFSGVDTLCFVKCDTAGVCDTTTVIISVDPVTDTIPLITNEDVPVSVGQPILSGVSPVDTVSYLNGPDYGTIVIDTTATGVPTGTITYVPDTNYVGFDTVTVVTCDDLGNCDTTIVLITVLPVMDTTPVVILEDSSFVLCPGTDSTTTVRNFGTVSILCGPMHGDTVVDPITGCVTYEADSNYVGQDTLCIVICDTVAGMCDTTLVPITIVPVRDTVLETIPEGDTLTLCPPSITVVDVLGSMDSLCPPMHGTMILDTTTGCVTYVPDTNFSGVDTLCFVKCDTAGVCDTTTVIISVDPVTDTIPLITNEDVPVSVGQPILSGVSPVDTVSYLNGPDYGTIVIDTTATGVPTGTITYVPDTNYVGFDTVTVVTCDDLGNCDTTIVLITVLPVMDTTPVVILEDSSFVLCPGTDSTTTVRNFGTVSILCGPMHGDTVVDPITGCVTYEADSNYVGQDTLCIVICDTVAGMCDTTLVPITIVPVRDTVLDTISEGDTLTLCPPSITVVDVLGSMDSLCPPMHGTMILDTTTGCVTYVPDTNFSGVDTLCFVKCDTAGVCDTTTVIISVDPVTDTIPLITNEDVPVSVGQPILSGVSPVDTVSYLNGPDYGTIVIDTTATGVPTGTITYVPDTNYVGFDTVTVVTCNATGICDTTVVLITVLPVMDTTPVVILEDSSFVLCPGTDSTTTVRNFGTVSILCGPMHGDTVVDPITGCVTYEADSNYVGQDTLCIVICDTVAGMCDTTLVPITIVPVRDTVLDTISEGDTLTLCPPSITVVDVLGSMDSLCPPMHGTMILDTTTGCVTYVPDTNFSGVDTLCFVKCDTAGVCDTTTVIISVDPVTDTIPLITNEDVPVSVGQPILSGVSPVDTVSYLNGPNHGTIVIDTTATGVPTGTITYVPDTNYIGLDTVTVVTCNATGICDTTVVLITVLPVKDTLPIVMSEDSTYELCPNGLLTNVSNLGTTTIICGPNHGTRTVIDPTTGCITYVPDSSYVGVDTLCIVICDTVVGLCDTTFVPITIVPVIDTIIKYINEDDSVTLCVPEMTDVDSLLSIDTLCGPMNGRVTLDTISGCVTYYSDTNFVGFDTVCVVKCDINNVCDTTIIIIVTGPVFDTIHKITNEDVPFTICPPELSNLGSIITSITTYCGPNHGSFDSVIATGCITYTPDTNFVGVDTLCIVSCDTAGNCDTTIVTITVVPVRDTVPLIVNEDDSITLCPRTDSTTDVDILSTVVVNCGPNFGKTRVDPITGCVTYIPDTNFVGVDTICIIVTDTNGVSDTTTYPITIVPVRDTLYDTLSTTTSITLCMPTTTKVDSLGGVSVLCPPTYADSVIVDSITGCVTYVRDSSYAGNDTMCIVICDTAGVCDTTTVIITVNRIFAPFDVMNDTICEGDCITLVSDTMQPGVIYRVHSPVGTIIGRLSTPTVVCPTTDSTFYIEAWDTITGVTSIWDTMTIFVTPFKSPGVSRSIVLCETGNIINLYDSLGGTPDTTGTWVDPLSVPFGTGYLGSYNPLTDTAGVYTYTIVNPVCPDTSATITITKSVAPNPGMFDSISLCQSGTTNDLLNNLLGTPDAGGTWSGPVATTNGDLGTLDPSIGIPARGNYVYTVTKIGCADDSSYVNVWIDTIEDASIRMDETSLCKGLESAQVYVTGATGGTFSTSAVPADNLSIDPVTGLLTFSNRLPFETRSGTYEVYYTTSGPCPETDTITINMTVYGDGCQIEIPQFISPNGDGKNDVLHIPGVEEFPNNVLKIFNRWGNVVYEKQAYDNSWNGSANVDRGINQLLGNGAKLPVGTYFYIFESGDERYPSFAGYVYVK